MTDLLECGHTPSNHGSLTTGYGVDDSGYRYCYDCCAARDKADMIEKGRATLYLVDRQASAGIKFTVQNWPGSLCFPVRGYKQSRRGGGFGSQRTDAWFTGPDGKQWHAINRGDMQIARCRRLKG
jgi:hypothetical protein